LLFVVASVLYNLAMRWTDLPVFYPLIPIVAFSAVMAGFADEDGNYEMEDVLEPSHSYTGSPQLLALGSRSQWQLFPPVCAAVPRFNNLGDMTAFTNTSESNQFSVPNNPVIQTSFEAIHLPSCFRQYPTAVDGLDDRLVNAMHSQNQDTRPRGHSQTLSSLKHPRAAGTRKVPTIKAVAWKPYEAAVRERYVQPHCKIKEICKMLMEEYGFIAK
jgi:hypothetical protein